MQPASGLALTIAKKKAILYGPMTRQMIIPIGSKDSRIQQHEKRKIVCTNIRKIRNGTNAIVNGVRGRWSYSARRSPTWALFCLSRNMINLCNKFCLYTWIILAIEERLVWLEMMIRNFCQMLQFNCSSRVLKDTVRFYERLLYSNYLFTKLTACTFDFFPENRQLAKHRNTYNRFDSSISLTDLIRTHTSVFRVDNFY